MNKSLHKKKRPEFTGLANLQKKREREREAKKQRKI
jgi:hypothetical protein